MKTCICSVILAILAGITYGQTISTFDSDPMAVYHVIDETTLLDQSAVGENLTWNFDQLSITGSSSDSYAAPSSAEQTTYPGTTSVLTINSSVGLSNDISQVLTKDSNGTISITALKTTELELNYDTDNARIGTFPLSYGYINTDAISGSYDYIADTTYSGTFSGTVTASVDAYGMLTTNDLGAGGYSGMVTRLKTVQNFSLTYIVPNAGTATQTVYYYYDNSTGALVLRMTTVNVVASRLSIDQTTTTIESRVNEELSVPTYSNALNSLAITKNPVKETLNLNVQGNLVIHHIIISDSSGKEILKRKGNDQIIPIAELQKGFYIATFDTNLGMLSRKFIKE